MTLIITLKSGAQIRTSVTGYKTEKSNLDGSLAALSWTEKETNKLSLRYVDIDEIAAIQRED